MAVETKDSFKKNSLIMSLGAVTNVFVALFFSPILTRLYSQEEFGTYYIYLSIVSISSLVITGMYPHALVVPKFRREFLSLLKLCFGLVFIGFLLTTLVLVVGRLSILPLIGANDLVDIWYLIPIGLLLTSINTIFNNWNVRRKEFKRNALSNVFGSLSNKSFQLGYSTLNSSSFLGLVYSDIISNSIRIIILSVNNMYRDFFLILRISLKEVKHVAKEFIKYPSFLMASNFVNRFSSDIPLYIISSFYGAGAVGAFGFANQMLNIPFNVIGNSIAPVYFQRANELLIQNPEELKRLTLDSYNKMLWLGCLAFGFLSAFGDIIFSLVFSNDWKLSGQIAMILSVYFVFKLISSPFARIFRVVRKEELTLKVNMLIALLRGVCILIGVYFNNILILCAFYSLGNLIGYAYNNIKVFEVLRIPVSIILKRTSIIVSIIFTSMFSLRIVYNYLIT